MQNTQKQPKYMVSRFNGQCCDCGSPIEAGEVIKWLSRGTVQCQHCALESEGIADTGDDALREVAPELFNDAPKPAADQWAAALAFDKQAPKAGASITKTKRARSEQSRRNAARKPASKPRSFADNTPAARVLSEIIDDKPADNSADTLADLLDKPRAEVVRLDNGATVTSTAPDDALVELVMAQCHALVNVLHGIEPAQVVRVHDQLAKLADGSGSHLRRHAFGKLRAIFGA